MFELVLVLSVLVNLGAFVAHLRGWLMLRRALPMDTAPKDGTVIALLVEHDGEKKWQLVRWLRLYSVWSQNGPGVPIGWYPLPGVK